MTTAIMAIGTVTIAAADTTDTTDTTDMTGMTVTAGIDRGGAESRAGREARLFRGRGGRPRVSSRR